MNHQVCEEVLQNRSFRMLYQSHEIIAQQRATARWKEWIPLVSQQLRLRNLIQITAYNVSANEKHSNAISKKTDGLKISFYYTLHLTTMSAPFYTSEKLESRNPKWLEIEARDLMCQVNAAVTGVVIRLWLHQKGEQDHVVTVWGVHFSGLVYLGPKPLFEPSNFKANTIVFIMHGGYFTAAESISDLPLKIRRAAVKVSSSDARPSYNVSLLLRLHTIQQAIKKQMQAAQSLREKIAAGGFTVSETRDNAVLRRLLNKSRPKAPERQELLRVRKQVELVRFRVSTLNQEKCRKQSQLRQLEKTKTSLAEANQNRGTELMNRYQTLQKEVEHLRDWKKSFVDTRELFLHTCAQLMFRRKQLVSELNHIYPIAETNMICGVHLPNSEDFAGHDEVMISVALGFVAHLVQMISIFLQLPLRYPLVHFGSRSKIMDHIVDKIPDKDREFPLFSRGKDKLQFNYGVYLLNKNIAQLRWYFNLPTQDLRATLPNLMALLHLRPGPNINVMCFRLEVQHRTLSGSSLDLRSSSQNASPVGSVQPSRQFEKGHRVSKSMGNPEIKAKDLGSLSYSLDKGLDEYQEMKNVGPGAVNVAKLQNLAHVGSEPILSRSAKGDQEASSSGDEARKHFLQSWEARGPAPVCSDDDADVLVNGDCERKQLETSLVDSVLTRRTEALARRTGSFNLVRSRHSSFVEDAVS